MASSSLYQKLSQLPLLESPKGKCPLGSNSSHGEWPQSQSPDPAYCTLCQEMTQSFQGSAVLPSKVTSLQVILTTTTTKKRPARNKGLRLKLWSLCENVLVFLKLILARYKGRYVSKLHCTLHNGSLKL